MDEASGSPVESAPACVEMPRSPFASEVNLGFGIDDLGANDDAV